MRLAVMTVVVTVAAGVGIAPAAPAATAVTAVGLAPVRVIGGPGHAGLYGWGEDTIPPGFPHAGDVLTSDYLNLRIVQHAPDGALRRVAVADDGHHYIPYEVAVNPVSGNIAFGDIDDGPDAVPVVKIYSMAGEYLRTCDPSMIYPAWLDYDPAGRLAVADARGDQIGIIDDVTCEVRYRFGQGTGAARLDKPRGIDFAPDGTLWINDVGRGRVAHFAVGDTTATYLGSFASPGADNRGLLFDPDNGLVYVVKAGQGLVVAYTPDGDRRFDFGSIGTGPGQFADGGRGITRDGEGNLWIGDMPDFRTQKFAPDGTPLLAVPSPAEPPPPGGFAQPGGVAVTAKGGIVVADSFNWRIQTFDAAGAFVSQFGDRRSLNYARGVAVDRRTGRLVVGNTDFQRVEGYGPSGARIWSVGGIKTVSVAVDQRYGTVYGVDLDNGFVSQISPDGRLLRRFDSGVLDPRGIAVDAADGSIWVSGEEDGTIAHLSPDGVRLGSFASGALQAADLEVDADTVYLADARGQCIRLYSKAGRPTGVFGGPGTAPGQFRSPRGLDLRGSRLFVVEAVGERVQELRIVRR